MKFSFEESMKNCGVPIMNIEHKDNNYQLYLAYNEGCACLIKDSSNKFISHEDIEQYINPTKKLSKEEKAFYQNIIIHDAFCEVLHKAGIYQDFHYMEQKVLNTFIYESLIENQIQYEEQWDYMQLLTNLHKQFVEVNPSKEDIGRKLDIFNSNEIYLSLEAKCIYFKQTSSEALKFNYGKYSDYPYFIYNLIWIYLHKRGFQEDSSITFEKFHDCLEHLDDIAYSYPDELKSQILKAFGNTEEIQNAFQLSPSELLDYLFTFFDSDTTQLQREKEESRGMLLKSIRLKATALLELSNLIK